MVSSTVMLVLEITSWQNIAREAGAVGLVAFFCEGKLATAKFMSR